jgi:type IV secretion/conjugal transfer VirB4 family ATPase
LLNLKSLLKGYNDETRSYAEILPWFKPVTPGLILNLDGSLLAGFEYSGVDIESSDDNELEAAIQSMETAMSGFDDHFTLWSFIDKRRRIYTQESAIHNDVARVVDQRWRDLVDDGTQRSVRHVICVSYQPFGGALGYFDEVGARVVDKQENFGKACIAVAIERLSRKAQLERLEGKLNGAILKFEDRLAQFRDTIMARVQIDRLEGNRFLTELANRCNLASSREQVSLPDNDHYFLNTLLPVDTPYREPNGLLRFEGSGSRVYAQMHSVKGYPGLASNGAVEQLLFTPADFTLVQMFKFLDQEKAKKMVQDLEGHYRANVKTPLVQIMEKFFGVESERVNSGQRELANDAQQALVEATVDNVNFGYHSMALQVLGRTPDEVHQSTQALYGVMTNAGYGLVKETINSMSAFAVTVPGADKAVTRTTLISSRNLADLTVVRTVRAGENVNRYLSEQRGVESEALTILPSASDVPELFNLHVGDVGHFMIVGPAGGGKTTFINFLIMMWQRYAPCRVIAIDKDLSNYITIKGLGGEYIDLRPSASRQVRMNPARWLADRAKWPQLRRWLELAMLAFDKSPLTPDEIRQLDSAITMAHGSTSPYTLSLIYTLLAGQNQSLAGRLFPWTRGSDRYGDLFDNEEDQFQLGAITGIEVGGLLADEHVAPAMLAYLFGVIDELVDGRTPVLIYLEEAWYLLGNPAFREMFEDWIRTMRKRTAAVGLATQSVADIRKTPLSSVLNDNIKTRIFLPNLQAFDSIDVYRDAFGLRDDEVNIIRMARQKRQYYVVQDNRRRLVELPLPSDILAMTRSDGRAKEIFNRCVGSGSSNWLNDYVEEMSHA